MPDDPTKTGQDRRLISLEQEHELRDWADTFGCSEELLREAVKEVGNSADAVRQYVANRRG
jgi:AraC-like DNA-binding protein